MQDKTLTCKDCAKPFVFSVRDQQFYAQKGFEHEPQRCRDCRNARKNARAATGDASTRELFDVVCAECGVPTQVPFRPRDTRPVYCRDCFQTHGSQLTRA
ncbi:MAG: zinc-ribbon domain containing protein [bacterium]|nr:zinc-ribbon domain containing protein [bacterium]